MKKLVMKLLSMLSKPQRQLTGMQLFIIAAQRGRWVDDREIKE